MSDNVDLLDVLLGLNFGFLKMSENVNYRAILNVMLMDTKIIDMVFFFFDQKGAWMSNIT
jgi:hypothetical protein